LPAPGGEETVKRRGRAGEKKKSQALILELRRVLPLHKDVLISGEKMQFTFFYLGIQGN